MLLQSCFSSEFLYDEGSDEVRRPDFMLTETSTRYNQHSCSEHRYSPQGLILNTSTVDGEQFFSCVDVAFIGKTKVNKSSRHVSTSRPINVVNMATPDLWKFCFHSRMRRRFLW